MSKNSMKNPQFNITLSEYDAKVIETVLDHGVDLLIAGDAGDLVFRSLPAIGASFLYHMAIHEAYTLQEVTLVGYCLDIAADAIAGRLTIEPEIYAALSPHLFAINRLNSCFAAALGISHE